MTRVAMPGARWLSIPLWFTVWFAISKSGAVSARILPDPTAVFITFVGDVANGALVHHALVSGTRAVAGFALAAVPGIVLGASIARVRLLDALLEPFIFSTYPVPKIALFPILSFLFGIGTPSRVAFAFLEAIYPIMIASIFAVRGIKPKLIWTAESMGASRRRILQRVLVPAALPGIFTGFRIALPLSLLVIVVTEMMGDAQGLGFYISDGGASFRPDRVYAGVIAVGTLGYMLDLALILVRRAAIHNG